MHWLLRPARHHVCTVARRDRKSSPPPLWTWSAACARTARQDTTMEFTHVRAARWDPCFCYCPIDNCLIIQKHTEYRIRVLIIPASSWLRDSRKTLHVNVAVVTLAAVYSLFKFLWREFPHTNVCISMKYRGIKLTFFCITSLTCTDGLF